MFTVAGWSTAAVPAWNLSAEAYLSQPSSFTVTTSISATTMNNGQHATLTVTVPAGTASGSYATLLVGSAQSQLNYNYSLVGVQVP
jgi:hypothetical protein